MQQDDPSHTHACILSLYTQHPPPCLRGGIAIILLPGVLAPPLHFRVRTAHVYLGQFLFLVLLTASLGSIVNTFSGGGRRHPERREREFQLAFHLHPGGRGGRKEGREEEGRQVRARPRERPMAMPPSLTSTASPSDIADGLVSASMTERVEGTLSLLPRRGGGRVRTSGGSEENMYGTRCYCVVFEGESGAMCEYAGLAPRCFACTQREIRRRARPVPHLTYVCVNIYIYIERERL